MNRPTTIITICLLGIIDATAQIKHPKLPEFSDPKPVYDAYQSPIPQPKPQLQELSKAERHDAQMKEILTALEPMQHNDRVDPLLSELRDDHTSARNNSAPPTFGAEKMNAFAGALRELNSMLTAEAPMSVADAYYAVEQAYGNTYLDKEAYDDIIDQSAAFIKTWMLQHGMDPGKEHMVHSAIKKFMSEPLSVTETVDNGDKGIGTRSVTHEPFYYDYDDYGGDADMRNTFITKCLATGYGQCASMPIVYLVLAERLGVTAYLSHAPGHYFVKHADSTGYIINYEATSGWRMTDHWYADHLAILPEAMRSGIYLDTLSTRKVVANCAFDLAAAYMRSGGPDTNFILDCLQVGVPHYPANNNLQSLFVYQNYVRTLLAAEMDKAGITTAEQIPAVPKAKYYYDELLKNMEHLKILGYQELPAGLYEELREQHEFKGRVQAKLDANTKKQRNLFTIPE